MSLEYSNEAERLFSQPLEEVAPQMATSYLCHEDRENPMAGNGAIFVLQTPVGMRRFRLEEAILYSHDYTMKRWPGSRGPEIARLNPAVIIGYSFHTHILPFGKVGAIGSAANIQLSRFLEVNSRGEPLQGKDAVFGGVKLFREFIGLQDRGLAHLTTINFRSNRAFYIAAGLGQPSPEELKRVEEEILKNLDL